jgi:formylglycine-generating enzyme required for sulfatase activity
LCGKIGGGANGTGDYADATKSQWFNACTSGGQNDHPYGDTYSKTTCNGQVVATAPVGSNPGCQSPTIGYEGVYDLSGNVWEWEDSCAGNYGDADVCRVRGGSFSVIAFLLRCDSDFKYARDHSYDRIGFRCCAP